MDSLAVSIHHAHACRQHWHTLLRLELGGHPGLSRLQRAPTKTAISPTHWATPSHAPSHDPSHAHSSCSACSSRSPSSRCRAERLPSCWRSPQPPPLLVGPRHRRCCHASAFCREFNQCAYTQPMRSRGTSSSSRPDCAGTPAGNSYLVSVGASPPFQLNTTAGLLEYPLGTLPAAGVLLRVEKITEAREVRATATRGHDCAWLLTRSWQMSTQRETGDEMSGFRPCIET